MTVVRKARLSAQLRGETGEVYDRPVLCDTVASNAIDAYGPQLGRASGRLVSAGGDEVRDYQVVLGDLVHHGDRDVAEALERGREANVVVPERW